MQQFDAEAFDGAVVLLGGGGESCKPLGTRRKQQIEVVVVLRGYAHAPFVAVLAQKAYVFVALLHQFCIGEGALGFLHGIVVVMCVFY